MFFFAFDLDKQFAMIDTDWTLCLTFTQYYT